MCGVTIMRKLLATQSHDKEVFIPVQCSFTGLIGLLQSISTFFILRCRQNKDITETVRFGASKSQGPQNTETAKKIFANQKNNNEFLRKCFQQLQNIYFLKDPPVVASASVAFAN